MKTAIKVSIEYEFGLDIDSNSDEELLEEINKIKFIINEDTEKFILSNLDNRLLNKSILYELIEN